MTKPLAWMLPFFRDAGWSMIQEGRREMKAPRHRAISAGRLLGFFLIMTVVRISAGNPLFAEVRPDQPAGEDPGRGAPPPVDLAEWKIKDGDDPAWARPDFDDSGWEKITIGGPFKRVGTFWLRMTVEVGGTYLETDPPVLSIYNLPTAFEVYWDGALVGRNGRRGSDRDEEISGRVRFLQILRAGRAGPGPHGLALRVSNFHVSGKTIETGIGLGAQADLRNDIDRLADRRLVSMGLYFVAALLGFFLFIQGKKRAALLFFGMYAMLSFLQSVWIYAIEKMGTRMISFARFEIFVIFGVAAAFVFLAAFLLWHFSVRRRAVILFFLALASAAGGFFGSNPGEDAAYTIAVPVAFGFFLAAVLAAKRKRGSGLALAGTGLLFVSRVAILFIPGLWVFIESLPGFAEMILTALFLAMFVGIIALSIRDENRALEAFRVRSQRLEAELLKKSIQPHFLMNTLLSVQSWFGRDPEKAGRLIEALAEEFRIINRIVDKPVIDLAEEIALCRSHLELMGYRRDAAYRFVVSGDASDLKVPPMLFHTLIENGLSHAYAAREGGTFTLSCERNGETVTFQLENDGSQLARISEMKGDRLEEGLGLKYVRTRLEESFPGRWELEYGPRESVWRVRIVIRGGIQICAS